jgi:hypothetical protein
MSSIDWDRLFARHEFGGHPMSRWLRTSTIRLAMLFNVNSHADAMVIFQLIRAIAEFRAMMFRKVRQYPDKIDVLMTIDQSLQPLWSEIAKARLDEANLLH